MSPVSAFIFLVYFGGLTVAPDFWTGVIWPWHLGKRLCKFAFKGGAA